MWTLEDAESKATEVDKGLPEEPADVSKLQKQRTYQGKKIFSREESNDLQEILFLLLGWLPTSGFMSSSRENM